MNDKFTLSTEELIERCQDWVSKLARSGGRDWTLRVPVDFNNDPDMLFTELGRRLQAVTQPPSNTSVEEELRSLRQWKTEAKLLLEQIYAYTDSHPDIKPGMSKVTFLINRAKKYDELAASTPQGAVSREAIEDVLLKTGKFNTDECSEIADVILKDLPRPKGAVWVRASEIKDFEPYRNETVFYKFNNGKVEEIGTGIFYRVDQFYPLNDFSPVGQDDFHYLQVMLDESTPSNQSDTVELLTWIKESNLIRLEDGKWAKWDNGKAIYRHFALDNAQLYDIFKKR